MSTGQELRDEGTAAVIAADVAPHRGYGDHVRAALDALANGGMTFTAEDVRELADKLAPADVEPHSPNLIPAVMGGWASAGRIHAVRMTKTTRASRRYSRNLVWLGGPEPE
ncbi:hypothetical protein [Luteipulveratus halotolerans]|uniref:Uncharacterized protein n=1 Tax=Luteipulveratus halotolerans TaxID=1631356 RepID=A0A0L6CJV5_9MICO|nr:hypothetical protein [Luteipulveratus halotolerans]KNX38067.1 hypothetical protein VV01_14415 [Luteipulveratus halotolerans]